MCINSDNFQRILAMAKAAIAPKNRLMISVTPQTRTESVSYTHLDVYKRQNLNYAISEVERIRKPELAGGALLDVGVYTINFASMVLGDKLKDVQATAIFREGVDMLDTIAMVFEGDRMATLQCGAREISDRMGSIFGTKGYIQVQNINNPEKITVFDKEHKEVAAYLPPAQITGYEYEVEACARAIAQGEKECPEMPHDETVRVMEIMDGIRKSWGYEIPLYE